MREGFGGRSETTLRSLAGLSVRSTLTDCPLGAFEVQVRRCSGYGDCTSICFVGVFERDDEGRCVVADDDLCFGCMACVAQCLDNGVAVYPRAAGGRVTVEEYLK